MKRILTIVGIIVAVLIVIVLALPFLIDANRFKPTLETQISTALGRKATIGNIRLSILSGGVRVDDFAISDDPAFSQTPFVTAKQLDAGVALIPLILSKRLEVSSFTLTEPQVSLIRSKAGEWNFSTIGAASKSSSSESSTAISVDKLKIANGVLTVGEVGATGKTRTYQNVDLDASNLSYTSQFPFTLTLQTPGNGTVKFDGKVGPINPSNAALTPVAAKLDVKSLDLALTGFVDPASGIAGVVDLTGDIASDGSSATVKGSLEGQKLKFAPGGAPAKVPVGVDYATNYDLKSGAGQLTQGDVHIGKALAHLTGSYDASGAETSVRMKLNGQGMSVPDVEGVLPAAGVTLPSGASLQAGSLDLALAITGPVNKLTITGPVNLSNGKLAGFDLKSKLGALSSFSGIGGGGSNSDTEIQTLKADLRQDASGTHASNLLVIVPSIGTITGDANVSATQQLDCKMTAKLSGALGVISAPVALLGGGKTNGGIPFTITGTTSNPQFRPDLGAAAGNLAKGVGGLGSSAGKDAATSVSGALGGLFGKKKSN